MNQGFGNIFCSEATDGALPKDQNSPKHPPFGLYPEQISGSAFTRPRQSNLKSWVYRMRPSVAATSTFQAETFQLIQPLQDPLSPNPYRWSAPEHQPKTGHFFQKLFHLASSGKDKKIFWYQADPAMPQDYLCNYDAEFIFIPYQGKLRLQTEFGRMGCEPGQIIVIPRGICFKISTQDDSCQGYLAENGGLPLKLPELGLMGANALAYPQHFYYPSAAYETKASSEILYLKFQQHIFSKRITHSPLNVVAWQGNYLPYFYDCKQFNALNSVSFDHPDPSIFTLLSSESAFPGIANLDLVIFPERLSVARHSFRLPYFHRNIMSELMGLIQGRYEAKDQGFTPGAISIHNAMTPHGPDFAAWQQENSSNDRPIEIKNSLAFMLESNEIWQPTIQAMCAKEFQQDYSQSWSGFPEAKLCKS